MNLLEAMRVYVAVVERGGEQAIGAAGPHAPAVPDALDAADAHDAPDAPDAPDSGTVHAAARDAAFPPPGAVQVSSTRLSP